MGKHLHDGQEEELEDTVTLGSASRPDRPSHSLDSDRNKSRRQLPTHIGRRRWPLTFIIACSMSIALLLVMAAGILYTLALLLLSES